MQAIILPCTYLQPNITPLKLSLATIHKMHSPAAGAFMLKTSYKWF